ncbi:efflux RND transporter periplasmic adaptor subunit [Leisingera daeponensis]|uniref:Efflux RND transporter periplasmic adaptor subunit n=1 Tax=Leisingera daeponensis TaxID=405746 RepID=A0ABS7NCM5_9RHOB|nr:efflux RND transporter periplasmic adaptor subunit [Leisingera daeponensis]MBY6138504.1 efflux RND transporter periplasmic adaptor subunit [Leisingera daeponensis]
MALLTVMLKVFAITLTVLAVAAFFSLRSESGSKTSYQTHSVEHGPLVEFVTATGTLDALVKVDISSQVSGRIAEVKAGFNSRVYKGEPLAIIDREGFQARVEEAKAAVEIALAAVNVQSATMERAAVEVEAAKLEKEVFQARIDQASADLSVARSRLARKESLRKNGTVAAADVEDYQGEVLRAEAQLREAEAQLAASSQRVEAAKAEHARAKAELSGARANVPQRRAALRLALVELERTAIRSPIDGVVIDRTIDEGQTVAAALEAPKLFTIAEELSRMVVHVSVDETDIGRIRTGQKAEFSVDAYPAKRFSGTVSEIRKSAKVLQNIVTYTVVLDTENPDDLLFPGMTALVDIAIRETEPVLKVPTSVLSYRPSLKELADSAGGQPVLWRLDGSGKPEAVEAGIGGQDASHTAILSNHLNEGDLIISGEIATAPGNSFAQFLRNWR